jgi:Tfp pilus assembly protein PilO
MSILNLIGAPQVILIVLIPIAIFYLGYFFGKKAGYIKRIKETEANLVPKKPTT